MLTFVRLTAPVLSFNIVIVSCSTPFFGMVGLLNALMARGGGTATRLAVLLVEVEVLTAPTGEVALGKPVVFRYVPTALTLTRMLITQGGNPEATLGSAAPLIRTPIFPAA